MNNAENFFALQKIYIYIKCKMFSAVAKPQYKVTNTNKRQSVIKFLKNIDFILLEEMM